MWNNEKGKRDAKAESEQIGSELRGHLQRGEVGDFAAEVMGKAFGGESGHAHIPAWLDSLSLLVSKTIRTKRSRKNDFQLVA